MYKNSKEFRQFTVPFYLDPADTRKRFGISADYRYSPDSKDFPKEVAIVMESFKPLLTELTK